MYFRKTIAISVSILLALSESLAYASRAPHVLTMPKPDAQSEIRDVYDTVIGVIGDSPQNRGLSLKMGTGHSEMRGMDAEFAEQIARAIDEEIRANFIRPLPEDGPHEGYLQWMTWLLMFNGEFKARADDDFFVEGGWHAVNAMAPHIQAGVDTVLDIGSGEHGGFAGIAALLGAHVTSFERSQPSVEALEAKRTRLQELITAAGGSWRILRGDFSLEEDRAQLEGRQFTHLIISDAFIPPQIPIPIGGFEPQHQHFDDTEWTPTHDEESSRRIMKNLAPFKNSENGFVLYATPYVFGRTRNFNKKLPDDILLPFSATLFPEVAHRTGLTRKETAEIAVPWARGVKRGRLVLFARSEMRVGDDGESENPYAAGPNEVRAAGSEFPEEVRRNWNVSMRIYGSLFASFVAAAYFFGFIDRGLQGEIKEQIGNLTSLAAYVVALHSMFSFMIDMVLAKELGLPLKKTWKDNGLFYRNLPTESHLKLHWWLLSAVVSFASLVAVVYPYLFIDQWGLSTFWIITIQVLLVPVILAMRYLSWRWSYWGQYHHAWKKHLKKSVPRSEMREAFALIDSDQNSVTFTNEAGDREVFRADQQLELHDLLERVHRKDRQLQSEGETLHSYVLRQKLLRMSRGSLNTVEAFTFYLADEQVTAEDLYVENQAFRDYAFNPENWMPQRREMHQSLLAAEMTKVRELSARLKEQDSESRITLLRGVTASGKSTEIRTGDRLKHAYVEDPVTQSGAGVLGSDLLGLHVRHHDNQGPIKVRKVYQVRHESVYLYQELLRQAATARDEHGALSLILDRTFRRHSDIEGVIRVARETDRKITVIDLDIPLNVAMLRQIIRNEDNGNHAPETPFDFIRNIFIDIRRHRQALVDSVNEPNSAITDYELYALNDSGKRVKVAWKENGAEEITVSSEVAARRLYDVAIDSSSQVAQLADEVLATPVDDIFTNIGQYLPEADPNKSQQKAAKAALRSFTDWGLSLLQADGRMRWVDSIGSVSDIHARFVEALWFFDSYDNDKSDKSVYEGYEWYYKQGLAWHEARGNLRELMELRTLITVYRAMNEDYYTRGFPSSRRAIKLKEREFILFLEEVIKRVQSRNGYLPSEVTVDNMGFFIREIDSAVDEGVYEPTRQMTLDKALKAIELYSGRKIVEVHHGGARLSQAELARAHSIYVMNPNRIFIRFAPRSEMRRLGVMPVLPAFNDLDRDKNSHRKNTEAKQRDHKSAHKTTSSDGIEKYPSIQLTNAMAQPVATSVQLTGSLAILPTPVTVAKYLPRSISIFPVSYLRDLFSTAYSLIYSAFQRVSIHVARVAKRHGSVKINNHKKYDNNEIKTSPSRSEMRKQAGRLKRVWAAALVLPALLKTYKGVLSDIDATLIQDGEIPPGISEWIQEVIDYKNPFGLITSTPERGTQNEHLPRLRDAGLDQQTLNEMDIAVEGGAYGYSVYGKRRWTESGSPEQANVPFLSEGEMAQIEALRRAFDEAGIREQLEQFVQEKGQGLFEIDWLETQYTISFHLEPTVSVSPEERERIFKAVVAYEKELVEPQATQIGYPFDQYFKIQYSSVGIHILGKNWGKQTAVNGFANKWKVAPLAQWLQGFFNFFYELFRAIPVPYLNRILSFIPGRLSRVFEEIKVGKIAKLGDRGNRGGNDEGLLRSRGSFVVDKYNPRNPFQVPLSLFLGLNQVEATEWLMGKTKEGYERLQVGPVKHPWRRRFSIIKDVWRTLRTPPFEESDPIIVHNWDEIERTINDWHQTGIEISFAIVPRSDSDSDDDVSQFSPITRPDKPFYNNPGARIREHFVPAEVPDFYGFPLDFPFQMHYQRKYDLYTLYFTPLSEMRVELSEEDFEGAMKKVTNVEVEEYTLAAAEKSARINVWSSHERVRNIQLIVDPIGELSIISVIGQDHTDSLPMPMDDPLFPPAIRALFGYKPLLKALVELYDGLLFNQKIEDVLEEFFEMAPNAVDMVQEIRAEQHEELLQRARENPAGQRARIQPLGITEVAFGNLHSVLSPGDIATASPLSANGIVDEVVAVHDLLEHIPSATDKINDANNHGITQWRRTQRSGKPKLLEPLDLKADVFIVQAKGLREDQDVLFVGGIYPGNRLLGIIVVEDLRILERPRSPVLQYVIDQMFGDLVKNRTQTDQVFINPLPEIEFINAIEPAAGRFRVRVFDQEIVTDNHQDLIKRVFLEHGIVARHEPEQNRISIERPGREGPVSSWFALNGLVFMINNVIGHFLNPARSEARLTIAGTDYETYYDQAVAAIDDFARTSNVQIEHRFSAEDVYRVPRDVIQLALDIHPDRPTTSAILNNFDHVISPPSTGTADGIFVDESLDPILFRRVLIRELIRERGGFERHFFRKALQDGAAEYFAWKISKRFGPENLFVQPQYLPGFIVFYLIAKVVGDKFAFETYMSRDIAMLGETFDREMGKPGLFIQLDRLLDAEKYLRVLLVVIQHGGYIPLLEKVIGNPEALKQAFDAEVEMPGAYEKLSEFMRGNEYFREFFRVARDNVSQIPLFVDMILSIRGLTENHFEGIFGHLENGQLAEAVTAVPVATSLSEMRVVSRVQEILSNPFPRPEPLEVLSLAEQHIHEGARVENFSAPVMDLTLRELENSLPYLFKLAEELIRRMKQHATSEGTSFKILILGRDAETFYDILKVLLNGSEYQDNVVLFPGSLKFWTEFLVLGDDERRSFFAHYGITAESIQRGDSFFLFDIGYSGSIAAFVRSDVGELFGFSIKQEPNQYPRIFHPQIEASFPAALVSGEGPYAQFLLPFGSGEGNLEAWFPRIFPHKESVGIQQDSRNASYFLNHFIAEVLTQMPRYHGPYIGLEQGQILVEPTTDIRVNIDEIITQNDSMVNPYAAMLIQHYVVNRTQEYHQASSEMRQVVVVNFEDAVSVQDLMTQPAVSNSELRVLIYNVDETTERYAAMQDLVAAMDSRFPGYKNRFKFSRSELRELSPHLLASSATLLYYFSDTRHLVQLDEVDPDGRMIRFRSEIHGEPAQLLGALGVATEAAALLHPLEHVRLTQPVPQTLIYHPHARYYSPQPEAVDTWSQLHAEAFAIAIAA